VQVTCGYLSPVSAVVNLMKRSIPRSALLAFLLFCIIVPVSGAVVCTAPAQCLTGPEAAATFGAGNYLQQSRDTCGYATDATGARIPQYCFTRAASTSSIIGRVTVAPATTTQAPVRVVTVTVPATTASGLAAPVVTTTVTTAGTTLPPVSLPTTAPTYLEYTKPPVTIAPATATTTPGSIPYTPPSTQGKEFTGTQRPPVIISAGLHQYAPLVGAGSPYYASQISDFAKKPLIYLQTDSIDNQDHSYFSAENKAYGVWTDFTTLTIGRDDKKHSANFRSMSGALPVKSLFFQVSRFTFPDNPDHWQNQYIPGLVASGEAPVYNIDADGYRYFRINFARVANQNPGDPPYYVGTVPYTPGQLGQGEVLHTADLPFTSSSIVISPIHLGGLSIPLPVSISSVSAGELTQAQLGYPNENMTLSCTDCLQLRTPSSLESTLLDADQTFYVRVVPVYDGGKAGVPSLPVEVTVHRPHPCTIATSDVVIRLPSAAVVWYMKPTFGEYSNHWYYPWGDTFIPVGLHSYEPPPPPEDKSWWEDVIDTFKSVVNFFSWVVTQYSQLWNVMEDAIVKYVGDALTIGWCSDHSECTTVLKTGLQAVMAAYGIPPTLPTGPELMDASTDYMVKLGADQLGAGELYDAYQNLPPEGKAALNELKSKAQENAEKLTHAAKGQRDDAAKGYRCFFDPQYTCTNRLPDPIFASIHPATVMVWVSNPAQNSGSTDRVLMTVSDSWHLYHKETRIVPALAPGEGVSIPVVLSEDYDRFMKGSGGSCDPNAASTSYSYSSSYENLSTCLQGAWLGDFLQPGDDTFAVTFSNGKNYAATGTGGFGGLDANSNGKSLGSFFVVDPGAGSCGSNQYRVLFPQGWSVATPQYSINPNSWDNFFEAGNGPNPNNGLLRNKT
jgi:hypothetical protein